MQKGKINQSLTLNKSSGVTRVLLGMKKYWRIYLLVLPALVWYILFAYYPMAGLQLAFKHYSAKRGIWGSEWVGLQNFKLLFADVNFWQSVGRTLEINLVKLVVCFPVPVILALMFNELRLKRTNKVMQTICTFPYFLSWVIVASIYINTFSIEGPINGMMNLLGFDGTNFLGNVKLFKPMLYLTEIWKEAGYLSIIYLAAIAGIDQEQYEAAEIDGATRLQRIRYITFPNIFSTISVMFILTVGGLMSRGFDQVFNMSNAATKSVAEILDMYIYRITFQSSVDFGFSTAVALFRSAINMILLVIADKVSKKLGGNGLFA